MNGSISDMQYMQEALRLAVIAADQGEVPIGAVVVDAGGVIIGRGWNQVEIQKSQQAHAEIIAIAQASSHINDWRLINATIYITLQPCMMCSGLIRLSRLKKIIYGASSPLFGYELDKSGDGQLYNKDVEIIAGVLADESAIILKNFFKRRRSAGE